MNNFNGYFIPNPTGLSSYKETYTRKSVDKEYLIQTRDSSKSVVLNKTENNKVIINI